MTDAEKREMLELMREVVKPVVERLDKVDARLDSVDERLEKIGGNTDYLIKWVDDIDQTVKLLNK